MLSFSFIIKGLENDYEEIEMNKETLNVGGGGCWDKRGVWSFPSVEIFFIKVRKYEANRVK